jgi:hypothetical protein
VYSLEATDEYEEAFDKLTSQIPNLEQELQKGLYLVLARTPTRAQGVYQSPSLLSGPAHKWLTPCPWGQRKADDGSMSVSFI